MKNVEQVVQSRLVPRLPVGVCLGAVACLGVGVLLTRVSVRPERAQVQPQSVGADQSSEVERLKQAVNLLEHRSTALAAAISSAGRDAELRYEGSELPKAPSEPKDTRSAEEVHQDEITALEIRFASEANGSRDSLLAARTMQAELSSAPLSGARVKDVACSTSLCRATLEQDASAKPLDINALIQSTPTVRRESMFNYSEEGPIKRVTIYSAREGHQLNPLEAYDPKVR